jgi:hypothetical protein
MTESASVSLVAVGDIQRHGACHEAAREGAAALPFAHLKGLIGGADVPVGNMETVLAHGGSPREDKLCLLGDPLSAAVLRDAGLDLVTMDAVQLPQRRVPDAERQA